MFALILQVHGISFSLKFGKAPWAPQLEDDCLPYSDISFDVIFLISSFNNTVTLVFFWKRCIMFLTDVSLFLKDRSRSHFIENQKRLVQICEKRCGIVLSKTIEIKHPLKICFHNNIFVANGLKFISTPKYLLQNL